VAGIAYLGPEGTFTEAALRAIAAAGLIPPGRGPDGSHSEAVTYLPTDTTGAALAAAWTAWPTVRCSRSTPS
jgi:prephenate dehydratase